ncbi:hypothetical protein [Clostridium sp.]|uniref:hypothetical protein n=1 Tax=Clostridium sp. TaxID=1506 RepID=UPI0029106B14|nr:hypothetical protein [Clostridium sp.]MDU7365404.1 hypothetical protein [Clostridium sp.]
MKWINTLIEKILKINYTLKIKNLLSKLRINEVLIISIILAIPTTIIVLVTKNLIVSYIFILLFIIIFIFAILFITKKLIDDINKIIISFLFFALITFIVTFITVVLSKFAYWIVPMYHSGPQDDKVYDLVFNTYTSIIAAVIGIAGTYLGAIYGGKKALEVTKIQLDQQHKENKNTIEENKKYALKIITKLLTQEIEMNYIRILGIAVHLQDLKEDFPLTSLHNNFRFEVYNNTKYELIKYSNNNSLFDEVIEVYSSLELLISYDNVNKIPKIYHKKVKTLYNKIYNLRTKIKNITIEDIYEY